MRKFIFFLFFVVKFAATAAFPDTSIDPNDLKTRVKLTLQEQIEDRVDVDDWPWFGEPPFTFVAEYEHPTKSFTRAMFGRPVPWFTWLEAPAIENFIEIITTEIRPNAIILIANPRIVLVKYRGADCMTIVAQITFVPEWARPEDDD